MTSQLTVNSNSIALENRGIAILVFDVYLRPGKSPDPKCALTLQKKLNNFMLSV